jgi:hypothetical protein
MSSQRLEKKFSLFFVANRRISMVSFARARSLSGALFLLECAAPVVRGPYRNLIDCQSMHNLIDCIRKKKMRVKREKKQLLLLGHCGWNTIDPVEQEKVAPRLDHECGPVGRSARDRDVCGCRKLQIRG